MAAPILSLTEVQAFTALRAFLLSTTLSTIEVIRGQQNRVGEPQGTDFIVMWPVLLSRLSTNVVTSEDNRVIGSISNNILTVTQVLQDPLGSGMILRDELGIIQPNTVIINQIDGIPGGVGNYLISPAQTAPSETIYAGVSQNLVPTQWTVQVEIHGPNSANNALTILGLFRSAIGVDAFTGTGASVVPLYCDEARELPFINAEQQVEYRWILDMQMQINPIISTDQQFADELQIKTIEADGVIPLPTTIGPIATRFTTLTTAQQAAVAAIRPIP